MVQGTALIVIMVKLLISVCLCTLLQYTVCCFFYCIAWYSSRFIRVTVYLCVYGVYTVSPRCGKFTLQITNGNQIGLDPALHGTEKKLIRV